jgi:hypothetical protein
MRLCSVNHETSDRPSIHHVGDQQAQSRGSRSPPNGSSECKPEIRELGLQRLFRASSAEGDASGFNFIHSGSSRPELAELDRQPPIVN